MVNTNVDGNETLADNVFKQSPNLNIVCNDIEGCMLQVCDSSALRVSYLAYEMWTKDNGIEPTILGLNYSIAEIFYITYGQVIKFRLIKILKLFQYK